MNAIDAHNLTKSFRGVKAVDGVDLVVAEGEVTALLGPNGAGKTTTIMMLLGVTEPDAGSVRLLGHDLPHGRSKALQHTNFTASYVGMPDRLRVIELLRVFASLYHAPRRTVDEVVGLFGLEPFLRRFASQLSSGQKTLVGLAKAFVNTPRLLVLDEPTASLDPEVADRVRDILRTRQSAEGFTLLITSHNMTDVERLCRRVVFLSHGRVVADGTPRDVAARYGVDDLEATFLSIASQARLT